MCGTFPKDLERISLWFAVFQTFSVLVVLRSFVNLWKLFWDISESSTGTWMNWRRCSKNLVFCVGAWSVSDWCCVGAWCWACTTRTAVFPALIWINCVAPCFWIFDISFGTFVVVRWAGKFDDMVDHLVIWFMWRGFIPFLAFSTWCCLRAAFYGFSYGST